MDPGASKGAPLGVLEHFKGEFAGKGFNLIFQPASKAPTTTTFPNEPLVDINGNVDPAPGGLSDNVLELNLTRETLTFTGPLGDVPNRGFQEEQDIMLNGVSYIQRIVDVTNEDTVLDDGPATDIRFEPGLWMHVPVIGPTLSRMASIPHGTTVNAQGSAEPQVTEGPDIQPDIGSVDTTPFFIGHPENRFNNFIARTTDDKNNVPRTPQDLENFVTKGTINKDIIQDPNLVLKNANVGKKIIGSLKFKVDTKPTQAEMNITSTPENFAGGISNISFLVAQNTANGVTKGPNARAFSMEATFWINTVEHEIEVPRFKPGTGVTAFKITAPPPHVGRPQVTFKIEPKEEITSKKKMTVHSTEIQYSQCIIPDFGPLSWPHVSVATLVPTGEIPVTDEELATLH